MALVITDMCLYCISKIERSPFHQSRPRQKGVVRFFLQFLLQGLKWNVYLHFDFFTTNNICHSIAGFGIIGNSGKWKIFWDPVFNSANFMPTSTIRISFSLALRFLKWDPLIHLSNAAKCIVVVVLACFY